MNAIAGAARPRFWYHGWNIVAVAILSQVAANGMPINAFSLFLRDWSAALHSPISTLELGLAALGIGSALLSPFVGVLSDRYPARWIFAGGLALLAFFHFGISYVTTTSQFLLLFMLVLTPALCLTTSIPANAVVSRWFVRHLGIALGLTASGLQLAGIILPPLIAELMPDFGWRTLWRAAGMIILFVAAPLALWVMRDRPSESDGSHYLTGDRGSLPLHGSRGGGTLKWTDVFKRRNFWLIVATYLPIVGLYGAITQNVAPIAASHGVSVQTAGVLISVFSLSQLVSTFVMGFLSDRFGNRLPLFGLAMATATGGLVVAFGQGVSALGLGIVLTGIGAGMWPLLPAAVAREFGSSSCGRAFGLLMLFIPILGPIPFAIARIYEVTGSYTPGLCGLAALALLGGLACLLIRERPLEAIEPSTTFAA